MIDNVGPLLCVQACAGDTELDESGPRCHGALSLPPPEALTGGGGGGDPQEQDRTQFHPFPPPKHFSALQNEGDNSD